MSTQISTHPKSLDEILSFVNSSTDVLLALQNSFRVPYVKGYIELAASDEWPTVDISDIAFKQYEYHRSMAGALLLNRQTWNIMVSVIMNAGAKDSTKITQFKALSEMLFVDESKLLSAILTKNIHSIYPNITFEVINLALGMPVDFKVIKNPNIGFENIESIVGNVR